MKQLYIIMLAAFALNNESLYSQNLESSVLSDAIIEKAFEVADANQDGVITKKEFTIFLNKAKKARKPKVVPEKELSPE